MITFRLNKLNISNADKVLDIGCGSGRHTSIISGERGSLVVASDLFIDNVNMAKERTIFQNDFFGLKSDGVKFCVADILEIPYCNNFFDYIICCEVVEHLLDIENAIREMVRVLRPGGIIVVSVPRFLPEKLCWILSKDYAGIEGQHVKLYKKNELISLLVRFGLEYFGKHYSHSFHTPFWLLKCFFGLNKNDSYLIQKYHDFLVWYIMSKSKAFMFLEKLLNPLFGKSLVLYLRKEK